MNVFILTILLCGPTGSCQTKSAVAEDCYVELRKEQWVASSAGLRITKATCYPGKSI